ncbi:hypothetical protein CHGG_00170 [Chaetomium globosum CBS 148.51]|uniref:Uncharacterized protein n=1 Tax=Chaetomium globosum (strain ATCC 6205 / CBS 148.51 / DSM 1962 / NBRC 6347 / NRRL 1970) TaxID=306901 RepID=Q2HHY4_CHAGB|nr:uncharacterized protein CHGG_00170 [Chaetomium globosum CBS 148.51]EAQ91935.1 hypothetical protein CHGG_00170 [Chaetomium globosum CBS 148.51]
MATANPGTPAPLSNATGSDVANIINVPHINRLSRETPTRAAAQAATGIRSTTRGRACNSSSVASRGKVDSTSDTGSSDGIGSFSESVWGYPMASDSARGLADEQQPQLGNART